VTRAGTGDGAREATVLHAWRHPAAAGAPGRCIGRTDLDVDPRRVRRLADRIVRFARRHDLPRIVLTSPLTRSGAVGRCLAERGWRNEVRVDLSELDFGRWDGRTWEQIPRAEVDAWVRDFATHAPGDGESVEQLLARIRRFDPGQARVVVTHGGWLSGALWLARGRDAEFHAATWPTPPRHGRRLALRLMQSENGYRIAFDASAEGIRT
jgi:alpha-ribazole phosphatase